MCDGLGRKFDYICPNTTLFQQRMLICDHWYMVNCSKAESNYGANLLIGKLLGIVRAHALVMINRCHFFFLEILTVLGG